MLRVALVGYGKMGRMIEALAPQSGCEIVRVFDIDHPLEKPALRDVDVAIEFTEPAAAVANIRLLLEARVPTVVGTTGWYQHIAEVREMVEQRSGSLVWAANFSIGVNIFKRMVSDAGRYLASQAQYGAYAWEAHHSAKKDAPSGTLLRLVEAMQAAGYSGNIDVSATRAGAIPGTHEIGFDSPEDTITLRHTARSREGFARGALHAARLIATRKGFFEFEELLLG